MSKGEITWAPLVAEDYWRVQVDAISIGGVTFGTRANVILDTGTSLITGPTSSIRRLNSMIGAQQFSELGAELDCNTMARLPTVEIQIAGRNFSLLPEDYVVEVLSVSLARD